MTDALTREEVAAFRARVKDATHVEITEGTLPVRVARIADAPDDRDYFTVTPASYGTGPEGRWGWPTSQPIDKYGFHDTIEEDGFTYRYPDGRPLRRFRFMRDDGTVLVIARIDGSSSTRRQKRCASVEEGKELIRKWVADGYNTFWVELGETGLKRVEPEEWT